MFCNSCGFSFDDQGQAFCPNCGAPIVRNETAQPQQPVQPQPVYQQPVQPQPVYQQPVYQQPAYQQPVYPQQVQSVPYYNTTPILVWGIIGLSFAVVPYVNFLGIIFSAIALSKAKAYLAAGGILSGKAKVGRILGIVGLILGIVFTIFWLLFFLAIGAFVLS